MQTKFQERQRNKDSPYNFSVPPSMGIDLEQYEKTGETKVISLNAVAAPAEFKPDHDEQPPPPKVPCPEAMAEDSDDATAAEEGKLQIDEGAPYGPSSSSVPVPRSSGAEAVDRVARWAAAAAATN